jgi:hypothetical protein
LSRISTAPGSLIEINGRNLAFQFGNSRQKPFTMRQLGDAQVFPVFIGELNQERAVDLLLDRSIDVLRQFEAG